MYQFLLSLSSMGYVSTILEETMAKYNLYFEKSQL